jgi:hypothetical protein
MRPVASACPESLTGPAEPVVHVVVVAEATVAMESAPAATRMALDRLN